MKNNLLALLVLYGLSLSSCISSSHFSFSKTANFNPEGTIKVLAPNWGIWNQTATKGHLTNALMENNFNIIADPYSRNSQKSGALNTLSIDSTFREFKHQKLNFTLNDEILTDYQVKIQERRVWNHKAIITLNIQVINTKTGLTEASLTFRQSRMGIGKKRDHKIIEKFARELAE